MADQLVMHTFMPGMTEDQCSFWAGPDQVCGLPPSTPVHQMPDNFHHFERPMSWSPTDPTKPYVCQYELDDSDLEEVRICGKSPHDAVHQWVEPKPEPAARVSDTGKMVAEYFEECVDVVEKKNPIYGDAWRKQGYMGNLARIMSKTDRLKAMLWGDTVLHPGDETVEDTLRDLANLTAFMYDNYQGDNRWGQ